MIIDRETAVVRPCFLPEGFIYNIVIQKEQHAPGPFLGTIPADHPAGGNTLPRIVDHTERRRQVARAARGLILEQGLDNVTVREIASRVGYSTAVVSHYFRSKKELMFLVFRETQVSAEQRFKAAIDARLPLVESLEALLPTDRDSVETWRVWFAFWSMTVTYDDFRDEQVIQARKTLGMIAGLLDNLAVPAINSDERDLQSRALFAMITGIATQATHDPEGWPLDRQRAVIARCLAGSVL